MRFTHLLKTYALPLAALLTTALTSCVQTTGGSLGMGGSTGGYGGHSSGHHGGSPSYGNYGSQGYGYSPQGGGPSYGHRQQAYRGDPRHQSYHGDHHSQNHERKSLPPGFTNDVQGLDYATDDVLDATNDYLKENGRIPPLRGYKNLFDAAVKLESSCDNLEKRVKKGVSPQEAHQLVRHALEASSYLKLRISRHSDIPARLRNTHAGVHRELEALDRKLGQ